MNTPAASVWLDAWERAMSAPPVRRPAVLLETAHGPAAQPASWPLGRREAALLGLRATLFGGTLESLAPCPQCRGMVEFALPVDELLRAAPATEPEPVSVVAAGHCAAFRLPDTDDLEAASYVPAAQRERFLLERCQVHEAPPPGEWPAEFLTAAAQHMADADPLGDITLALTCPDCSHAWAAPFDTGEFLWSELHSWAGRLMSEIHVLAAAYGWTEPQILALPPHRRRFYLERSATPS